MEKKSKLTCPSCGGTIENQALTFCPHCGVNMHKSGGIQGAESGGSSPATKAGCFSILFFPFKLLYWIVKAVVQVTVRLGKWLHRQKLTLPIREGIRTSLLVIVLTIGGGAVLVSSIVSSLSGPTAPADTASATPDMFSGMFAESTADVQTARAALFATGTASAQPTQIALATEEPSRTSTNTPEPTERPSPTNTATPEPTPTPERTEAQVVEVVDGDTIRVSIDGELYLLRYIGIDAPDLDEQTGLGAKEANAELVADQTVYLEKDMSDTDQYERLLRYVFLASGTFVNAELVRQGHAQSIAYPPDVTRQETLDEMEEAARAAERGIWVPTPTLVPSSPTPLPATATPVPPSATPLPPSVTPVPVSPTPVPPTATTAPVGANVQIVAVDKRAEYVDLANYGDQPQDLAGWRLVSERGNQECRLEGVLNAGATLRVWAMAEDRDRGGYNCGFGTNIWNNRESDPAALYDAAGQLVDRYP